MIETIKKILGIRPPVDWKGLVENGAIIIDVRSKSEYNSGHISGSQNIPLDTLATQFTKIPKGKIVIAVCASGMRSASAKSILVYNGFEAYNGGGWYGLQNKIG